MTDKSDSPEDQDTDTVAHTEEGTDAAKASAPTGAILVTSFLTVVMLVFWFGTYIFNALRG